MSPKAKMFMAPRMFQGATNEGGQPKAPPPPLTEPDREFFRKLEMSDTASGLNRALKYLESKQYGLRMYAVAVEEAKNIHRDLPADARTERVRQVYHRVKAEYEREKEEREKAQARAKAHPNDAGSVAQAAAAEERLKNINLLLLYYASGLKHIYEDHEAKNP
ncbi:uncharacterized protein LOC142794809 [Rhipicephalus microplus]|uniref:uncharacterized protein LOC142794809 n=1 Tax=Rhipicephalus microplus TaxID=6941 RepID=UPI003F6C4280